MSNEEYSDLISVGLVVLALGVAALYWLASVMERQDEHKRYVVDEEANWAELDGFARGRDVADEVRNG